MNDTWYRLNVRSRRQRRVARQAALRAALIYGAATGVAFFIWAFNVLGRSI